MKMVKREERVGEMKKRRGRRGEKGRRRRREGSGSVIGSFVTCCKKKR